MCACLCVRVCVCVYFYTCVCARVHACVCVYIAVCFDEFCTLTHTDEARTPGPGEGTSGCKPSVIRDDYSEFVSAFRAISESSLPDYSPGGSHPRVRA